MKSKENRRRFPTLALITVVQIIRVVMLEAISVQSKASAPSFLEYNSKPAFYETWSQFGPYYTEGNLVTALNSISNLNLTAYYSPFCVIVDGGWQTSYRDAEGKLQFNLFLYPSGTNILKLIHAYGCKAMLWTEENGAGVSGHGFPSTWGTNIEHDAKTIAGWGFDGAKFDLAGYNTAAEKIDKITRFDTAFRSVATNRQTYFYHDVGEGLGRDQFRAFPPGAVICENSENDLGFILHWTDTMLTHLPNVNGKNQWSCGRELYESSVHGPSFLKVWSMLGSPYVFTALTKSEPWYFDTIYTNRECIALNNDPLYAAPTKLFHTLTNVGLARLRADGTTTALAFNMSTNQTQSLTFQFSDLGLPANYPVDIRDIYNGIDLGKFTNSYSFTLGPVESILLTFDSEGRSPLINLSQANSDNLLINIQGRSGQKIVLQRSADFQTWFPIATNILNASPWSYSTTAGGWGTMQYLRTIRE